MSHLVNQLTTCGLMALSVCACGCLSVPWTPSADIAAANPAANAGVTVIFVESPRDICSISGLPRVADHFNQHGVRSLYYDPWLDPFNAEGLADLVRYVKVELGQRVMLVGWSLGSAMALDAVDVLGAQGVQVDTVVLLDCFNLNFHRGTYVEPPNIGRLVVARSQYFAFPAGFRNAATFVVGTWNHMAVATHPDTIEMLFTEARMLEARQ